MGRLHQEQFLVRAEVADRLLQEVLSRHVVGIEHDDEFAFAMRQPVIEIAGLGVTVVVAGEVADAEFDAQRLQPLATVLSLRGHGRIVAMDLLLGAAVVEQEDVQLALGIDDAFGRRERRRHDVEAFVIGGDEHVDRGCVLVLADRSLRAIDRLGDREQAQEEHHDAVDFSQNEDHPGREIERRMDRWDGAAEPPEHVSEDDEGPEAEEHRPEGSPDVEDLQHHHQDQGTRRQHELRFDAQGQTRN